MLLSEYYNHPNAEIICLIKAKQQEYFGKDYLLYMRYLKKTNQNISYDDFIPYKYEAKALRENYEMYLETLDAFR